MIDIKGITKSFGSLQVLKGIDRDAEERFLSCFQLGRIGGSGKE